MKALFGVFMHLQGENQDLHIDTEGVIRRRPLGLKKHGVSSDGHPPPGGSLSAKVLT